MASSLGLFAREPASRAHVGRALFLKTSRRLSRSGSRARALTVHCGRSGCRVLLHGNIDNRRSLALELGAPAENLDHLYLAAFEMWGESCDLHLVGDYCSLIEMPDGGTRLARSPWRGPPLVYSHDTRRTMVASVPRVLLAAGLPAELDERHLVDSLTANFTERRGAYKDTLTLDVGQCAWLRPDGSSSVRSFYDHTAVRHTRLPRRQDYVDAVESLVQEGLKAALDGAKSPGALLSGGLDSSNVAVRAIDHLPADQQLKTFTFRPHPDFNEPKDGPFFGDDWQFVEELARMHPRLQPHWARADSYDQNWERLFLAIGCAPYALQNMSIYEPTLAQARDQGCDVLLDSAFGNYTFSNDARWAYTEFLMKGRWTQLHRAVAALRPRPRPFALGCLWHGVGPALPDSLWAWYQRRRGRDPAYFEHQIGSLQDRAAERHNSWGRLKRSKQLAYRSWVPSRRRWLELEFGRGSAGMGEIHQGFEQIYGVRMRDPTAYRPLVEFCLGLPTELFLHDGSSRWLARELGRGRLPEEQRTNRRYGLHNCDWHERGTPRLSEWGRAIHAAKGDPLLSHVLDFDRLERILAEWPSQSTLDRDTMIRFVGALPRAVSAARFVSYVTGSNR
jgi:asparagine synthase (glutamine-hydrolysing)